MATPFPDDADSFKALLPTRELADWKRLLPAPKSLAPSSPTLTPAQRRNRLTAVGEHFITMGHSLDCALTVDFALRCGLAARRPLGADLHLRARRERELLASHTRSASDPEAPLGFGSMSLFGAIGTGKSRTVRRILSTYQQTEEVVLPQHGGTIIQHVRYVSLVAPAEASIRGLYESFVEQVDSLIGTSYRHSPLYAAHTIHSMRDLVACIVRAHGIGLLLVDEAGNIDARKSSGYQAMVNSLVGLSDLVGLPLALIGTPLAQDALSREHRLSTRILSHCLEFDPLSFDKPWHRFVRSLLALQQTKSRVPFSQGISAALWRTSGGILRNANTMFILAQEYLLATKDQPLTPELLDALFEERPAPYRRLVTLCLRQHAGEDVAGAGEVRFLRRPDVE